MTPPDKKPELGMPRWMLYGLIAKGLFLLVVVTAVVLYVKTH